MKFCSNCENMYYLSIDQDDSDKLMYYCRNCGSQDDSVSTSSSSVISSVQLTQSETSMSRIVNKYTKLDPTLPRINRIPCPNAECDTNTKETPLARSSTFATTIRTSSTCICVLHATTYGRPMRHNRIHIVPNHHSNYQKLIDTFHIFI